MVIQMAESTSTLKPSQWADDKIKQVTKQALEAGNDGAFNLVYDALKELAFMCAKRGMTLGQFKTLRNEIVEAIENVRPEAGFFIEEYEKTKTIQA